LKKQCEEKSFVRLWWRFPLSSHHLLHWGISNVPLQH